MGAYEREDKPLQDLEGKDAMWYCYQVSVTDTSTGDKYVFPCKDWVEIGSSPFKRSMGKELELKDVEQSQVSVVRSKCRNEPLKCMTGRLKCMTGIQVYDWGIQVFNWGIQVYDWGIQVYDRGVQVYYWGIQEYSVV